MRKLIGYWLLLGVFMILIQILLGGITRLTGSGLSITEWDILMGSLPPINEYDWQQAFNQYKQFPQYTLMNSDMTLNGFKSIFWWEFIHRLWARLMGVAFLVPFVYFLFKKMINWKLGKRLIIIFILGALQGLVGWIMVQSGLIDKPWVNPLNLSAHLILALILYCYLFWVALDVMQPSPEKQPSGFLLPLSIFLFAVLFIQLFYGGLMAGNKAALFYPTFPKIGATFIPNGLFTSSPWYLDLISNIGMIHLIHRSLGFILALSIFYFYWKSRKYMAKAILKSAFTLLPLLVIVQVFLGILTLVNSLGRIPLVFGVLHQLFAVLLLTDILFIIYKISQRGIKREEQAADQVVWQQPITKIYND
ncbi:MAG: COX15/CtaA family protein [Chitinophagales bacterium]|nr:COX15/CtaA family protein [Chitinophagales bacterium]